MASEWYTLASQKLFLAETLLTIHQQTTDGISGEAALQGSMELALRARRHLLTLIAHCYQHQSARPGSLAELIALVGDDLPETGQLAALSQQPDSWWGHLEQLESSQASPRSRKKTVSSDNIIAVAVDTGPDRTAATLATTLTAMKQFMNTLTERHDEW